jgi:uncharacterized membrane protein YidH (DUF202 family)
MTTANQTRRILRWYPPSWRQRYGEELTALMEDAYGVGPLPPRVRVATARSGLVERVRASGLGPSAADQSPEARSRRGSLLVLCAWALCVIGGAMFAKLNEHWDAGLARPDRVLPTVGYDVVQGAAALGALIVLAAGLLVAPTFLRALRQDGWSLVRRQVRAVTVIAGSTLVLMAPLVVWAQHLSTRQRNGGLDIYTAAFLAVGLGLVATVGAVTSATVSLVQAVHLPRRSLHRLGRLALLMSGVMVALLAGLTLWWATLAADAPSALGGPVPADLVVAGLLMVLGCVTAVVGARRIVANPLS